MDQGFSGVGVSVPQVFPDGKVDISVIRDISLSAEQMGYDSLWTQERIIGQEQNRSNFFVSNVSFTGSFWDNSECLITILLVGRANNHLSIMRS